MTDSESRYAQIEKELLAVQFSLECFNQYFYDKKIIVESDHKPVESVVKKSLPAASPRLQRSLLRMQKYDYTIIYRPGKELVVPLPETAEESMKKESIFMRIKPFPSFQQQSPN